MPCYRSFSLLSACLFLFDPEVLDLTSVMGNVYLKKTPTKQENALNPAVSA